MSLRHPVSSASLQTIAQPDISHPALLTKLIRRMAQGHTAHDIAMQNGATSLARVLQSGGRVLVGGGGGGASGASPKANNSMHAVPLSPALSARR